jgi:hypothetical protein
MDREGLISLFVIVRRNQLITMNLRNLHVLEAPETNVRIEDVTQEALVSMREMIVKDQIEVHVELITVATAMIIMAQVVAMRESFRI